MRSPFAQYLVEKQRLPFRLEALVKNARRHLAVSLNFAGPVPKTERLPFDQAVRTTAVAAPSPHLPLPVRGRQHSATSGLLEATLDALQSLGRHALGVRCPAHVGRGKDSPSWRLERFQTEPSLLAAEEGPPRHHLDAPDDHGEEGKRFGHFLTRWELLR